MPLNRAADSYRGTGGTPPSLRADADGFLVREDGTAAYPVRNGIPSLLPESSITIDRKA